MWKICLMSFSLNFALENDSRETFCELSERVSRETSLNQSVLFDE